MVITRRATASTAAAIAPPTTVATTATSTATAAIVVAVVVMAIILLPGGLGLLRVASKGLHGLAGSLGRQVGNGARNVLGILVNVEALVDAGGNRLNLSSKIPLNVVEVEAVFPVDEVDGKTKVTVSARSTNSVQVGFGILGEVKVDDNVDSLDINTTSEEIGADEVSADAVAEVVEDAVASLLLHAGVTVEARVAKFGDFLGKQFNTVGGVAEDDGLVNLEFGEERVQTVNLLLLLDKGVVLRDTAKSELVHEVDFVRAGHVAV